MVEIETSAEVIVRSQYLPGPIIRARCQSKRPIKTLRVEPRQQTCRSIIRHRPGDHLGWPFRGQNPILRSTKRDTKVICWLVLERVSPIGSHFWIQIPNPRSINRDTKNTFFGQYYIGWPTPEVIFSVNTPIWNQLNKIQKHFFRLTQRDILRKSSK